MNCPVVLEDASKDNSLREEFGLDINSRIVLYHGNLSEGRGLDKLVEAASFLSSNTYLVVMGSGPLQEGLEIAASMGTIKDKVFFKAPVLPSVLMKYVSDADLGVVFFDPVDLNNYLASPNKLFDYLMAGVPVVTSDLPEVRKVVLDNKVGVMVDEGDSVAIANGINGVLESKDYADMKLSARQVALDFYNWGHQSRGLIDGYAGLNCL